MAIYSCSVKPISRSTGRSATASAAYRTQSMIEDERTGEVHDYRRKRGVECSQILLPASANDALHDRSTLWNAAEHAETRGNARVAREVLVAIPHELNAEQRRHLIDGYSQSLVDRYQVAADYAIHQPDKAGDNRNYHAHIMITTRRVDEQGFGAKTRELDNIKTGRDEVTHIRAQWEEHANQALERAQIDARIDHRSYEQQGLEQEPTVHVGVAGTAIDRRGEFSERTDINNTIRALNQERIDTLKSLKGLHAERRELDQAIKDGYAERNSNQGELKQSERLDRAVTDIHADKYGIYQNLQAKHQQYKGWHDRQIHSAIKDYHQHERAEPSKRLFERKTKFEQRHADWETEKHNRYKAMHDTIREHRAPDLDKATSMATGKAAYRHKIKKDTLHQHLNTDTGGEVDRLQSRQDKIQAQLDAQKAQRGEIKQTIGQERDRLNRLEGLLAKEKARRDQNRQQTKSGKKRTLKSRSDRERDEGR